MTFPWIDLEVLSHTHGRRDFRLRNALLSADEHGLLVRSSDITLDKFPLDYPNLRGEGWGHMDVAGLTYAGYVWWDLDGFVMWHPFPTNGGKPIQPEEFVKQRGVENGGRFHVAGRTHARRLCPAE